ncbi:MAG: cyclopropane-fatty-acyl-phospholipid synthase family protein [Xanthobacteraceae bacterium]
MSFSNPSYPSHDGAGQARQRPSMLGRLLDRSLPRLQTGRLDIALPNMDIIARRGERLGPEATMAMRRWRALWRLLSEGEDGFCNGYIDGDWTTSDLVKLLDLGMDNETALDPHTRKWLLSFLRNRIGHTLRANTRNGSRRNIAAHYDLGNDFFRPWLDAGMNYSAALYLGDEALERAQEQKLDRIGELLQLRGGETILEIGCGWGALAERLIRHHGASVRGITLSTEQLRYATTRLTAEIHDGRAEMRLQDYRDVTDRFDRIASIEMVEAVGERYWPVYFAKLRACLAAGGVALLQAITIDDARFAQYRKRPDFIQRRIFPGGMLPTRAILEREAARAGLKLTYHQSFGDSYERTLHEWRRRFLQARPKLEALGLDARFQRLWDYYLAYCEVGFRHRVVDVGFFQFRG